MNNQQNPQGQEWMPVADKLRSEAKRTLLVQIDGMDAWELILLSKICLGLKDLRARPDVDKSSIKNCPTEELFEELESREDVLKCKAGLYQPYDIRAKYGAPPLAEGSARLKVVAMRLDETSDTADS